MLTKEPADYQLTVHYHNYAAAMSEVGFLGCNFVDDFIFVRANIQDEWVQRDRSAMYNFIRYYGTAKIEQFLTEVMQVGLHQSPMQETATC